MLLRRSSVIFTIRGPRAVRRFGFLMPVRVVFACVLLAALSVLKGVF